MSPFIPYGNPQRGHATNLDRLSDPLATQACATVKLPSKTVFMHDGNYWPRNVPDFPITWARVCQRRLKMPATSKQKGDLIRQHLEIEKHLDEIAKILEITVSKLTSKIKAGSWWDLSQKDAKKVLDFLQRV
jgi:hypothetical protein